MIALCNGLLFYKYLLQIFPSVMTQQLMLRYHLNGTALGNLTAAFFYGYAITQIFSGYFVDRYGLKKIATISLFIAACGVIIFAASQQLWISFLGRVLMGAGGAFATVCYLRCTTSWCPPKLRSLADGSLTLGVMLGAFCAQAPLALSIKQFGLQSSLWMMVAVGICLAVTMYLFLSDGSYIPHKRITIVHAFKQIIGKQQNWLLAAYSGLAFAPLAVFGGLWGTPFLQASYHYDKPIAATMISLCYIGFGIGGPLFGYLAKKCNSYFKCMFAGLLISFIALCFIVYVHLSSSYFLDAAMILLGLGTGGFMLGFTLGKSLNSIILSATIVAFINSGDAILGAVTEPMIGKILDVFYAGHQKYAQIFSIADYHKAFVLLIIYLLLAAICLLRLHRNIKQLEKAV
jgi:MFS family permease